jgi:mono/diheme cytochrome c family protein
MKLKNFYLFFILTVMGLGLASFTWMKLSSVDAAGTMPDNVKAIIDKSCFGCHNTDSQNLKSKEKLDFKTLDTLSNTDKTSKLNNIAEMLRKGEMPPKKFLEKFPDKKLTPDEQKAITKWVKVEIKNLMKE